jgi:hypothetical protein
VEEAADRVDDQRGALFGGRRCLRSRVRDALHRGEEEEADAVGFGGFERGVCLPFLDELEDAREGAIGRLVQCSCLLTLLAGEMSSSGDSSSRRRRSCAPDRRRTIVSALTNVAGRLNELWQLSAEREDLPLRRPLAATNRAAALCPPALRVRSPWRA